MAHSILPTVLLTRPAPQSEQWAELIAAEFNPSVPVVSSPVLEVEYRDPAIPGADFEGLIFTSANAVKAYARLTDDRALRAYCVGDRTASVAISQGFNAISASGSVDELLGMVLREVVSGKLLYPRGAYISRDLAKIFSTSPIKITEVIVYQQNAVALSNRALSVLNTQGPVLIPLFSPRSAEMFVSNLSASMKSDQIALCFSQAVQQKTVGWNFAEVRVCAHPNADEMIGLLREYIEDGSA